MVLVVLAAGMGSRYGGMKQTDPIGAGGEFIIDYSIYDAVKAGFDKIVFVIKPEHRELFEETVGKRIKGVRIEYAYQTLDDIPRGFSIPDGRVKPWGTGHALFSAREYLTDSFAVINADDFYGARSFKLVGDYLREAQPGHYCMAGFLVKNTVTETGSVSRAVCEADENGDLTSIIERTKIVKEDGKIYFIEDGEKTKLDPETVVSMNLFGFTADFVSQLESGFKDFLANGLKDPLKSEYYIALPLQSLIQSGKASLKVLKTPEKWFGVTYKEDKAAVVEEIKALTEKGVYKKYLWE